LIVMRTRRAVSPADARSAHGRASAPFLGFALICSIWHWRVILACHASGGTLVGLAFFLFAFYVLWRVILPCPASGGTLFDRKKGGKND